MYKNIKKLLDIHIPKIVETLPNYLNKLKYTPHSGFCQRKENTAK